MSSGPSLQRAVLWVTIGIGHFVSAIFIFILCSLLAYDFRHGYGSAGDGYMLPFFLIPIAGPAAAISLWIDIQQIRKNREWSWALWPVVVILSLMLISIAGFLVLLISALILHRPSK